MTTVLFDELARRLRGVRLTENEAKTLIEFIESKIDRRPYQCTFVGGPLHGKIHEYEVPPPVFNHQEAARLEGCGCRDLHCPKCYSDKMTIYYPCGAIVERDGKRIVYYVEVVPQKR